MKSTKLELVAVIVGAACLSTVAAQATPVNTVLRYEWRFGSDANPSAEVPGSVAVVTPGAFASGWLKDLTMLPGGAGGYWDLGRSGSVALNFQNPLGGGAAVTSVKVEVSQWWDGGIYRDIAAVAVPGANQGPTSANIDRLGSVGGWVVDTTEWMPDAGASLSSVTLAGSAVGSVVDSIVVEATVTLPEPPQLSMRPISGNRLEITWPAAFGGMALEATSDLLDPASWTKVEATVQVGSTTCSVEIDMNAPMRFYRLRQP